MTALIGFRGGDERAIAWTIAGSDSGGGAGMQADMRTFTDFAVHGCSVITALTAQNTCGVDDVEIVSARMLESQWRSLQRDLPARALKTGMLGDGATVRRVAALLDESDAALVCDPVLFSSSGHALLSADGAEALRTRLVRRAAVVTPNLPEAAWLARRKITSLADVAAAADEILALGAQSVLIKGGHFGDGHADDEVWDYFADAHARVWLLTPRQPFTNVHGTGCVLSAAIAAAMARGYPVRDAVVLARAYSAHGIRASVQLGKGMRSQRHGISEVNPDDFPRAVCTMPPTSLVFPSCGAEPIGFYPIVNRAAWVERLLPLGVRTIQLRVKDLRAEALGQEIERAIAVARHYHARLFVNDHWEWALRLGAYGVHLGQDDLKHADLGAIARAGLRLGVSTHCPFEVAVAHGLQPSYTAVGPIFPTTLKAMPFAPLTAAAVTFWKGIVPYPIVAIGGISLERAPAVWEAGADGIAVVSDVVANPDPEERVRRWLGQGSSMRFSRYPIPPVPSFPCP